MWAITGLPSDREGRGDDRDREDREASTGRARPGAVPAVEAQEVATCSWLMALWAPLRMCPWAARVLSEQPVAG